MGAAGGGGQARIAARGVAAAPCSRRPCPQLLRREGRVVQLPGQGPPRGLQGAGAGRVPPQRGGEWVAAPMPASAGARWASPTGPRPGALALHAPRPALTQARACAPPAQHPRPRLRVRPPPTQVRSTGEGTLRPSPLCPSPRERRGGTRQLDPPAGLLLSLQIRERLGVSLGERPPTLVPVTHVMMCMNCGCDFSLTLRRHHCHACGKVSHVSWCGGGAGSSPAQPRFRGPERGTFTQT